MTNFSFSSTSIRDIRQLTISSHYEVNGHLIVIEEKIDSLIKIKRSFVVFAGGDNIRGQHAHKKCSQLLICINGTVNVNCNDAEKSKKYLLSKPTQGLLIPPGIWSEQRYQETNSILMVLCDRLYETKDYIRDYDMFLKKKRDILKSS